MRAMYSAATDPEGGCAFGYYDDGLRRQLSEFTAGAAGADETADLDACCRSAAAWSAAERDNYLSLLGTAGCVQARDGLARRAALACAPLALHTGAWLQWMSGPGNADEAVTLQVLSLYASDLGLGHPRSSRGSLYRAVLHETRTSQYAVPPGQLALDERVTSRDLYLPAMLLAMSRRPDTFRPEILGADLCLRTVGVLPALALVREEYPAAADWAAIDPGGARLVTGLSDAQRSRDIVAALLADRSDPEGERIRAAFAWALATLRCWSSELRGEMDMSRDPGYEMAGLLRRRAREASVYHQDYMLEGRPLSQWLLESRTSPSGLMSALAGSRLIRPGHPDSSPLVNGLILERGPMFRVFTAEDITVIRRWIESLPAREPARERAGEPARERAREPGGQPRPSALPVSLPPRHSDLGDDRAPAGLRDAYRALQYRSGSPRLRRYALDYVRGWLARSARELERGRPRLPARWPRQGLRPWLLDQHDQHDQEFTATAGTPVPSREDIIDSTLQLAPLTLIDGSWLQGFTDYEHASSEHGHFLFETYWDELGNGLTWLNHPLIYREVLAEMGIVLPPTASREFAWWPGFRESSFRLPVYWLSIGRFPRTFMPELLGLNLAMELSGVGGGYRRSRIALREHGFSTRFVDIHNTIDNVGSGHSAWAAAAVDSLVTTALTTYGTEAQASTWKRVRTGFRSLNPPAGLSARRAARRARGSA